MKDRIILLKIRSYLKRIERILGIINELNEDKILELDESYALTQFITNIYSLVQNISDDKIADRMLLVIGRGLITCRNISSHDYDSLNWDKVKILCKKLISKNTNITIEECLEIANENEQNQKKYE